MKHRYFQAIGWIILLSFPVLWLTVGYADWYFLLVLLAYISFSMSDGSEKKVNRIKKLRAVEITKIVIAFIISVALVFSLVFIANYLIKDYFHFTGLVKEISIIIAILLSLYPVKIMFGTVLYKVMYGKG